jgi:hypothetical protein
MAFSAEAAIGIAANVEVNGWPEQTELHERAHLVHAFLPAQVGALLAQLPSPAQGEYAATDPGEHFSEMAGAAWQVVAEPLGVCVDGTPLDRLEEAERRVPGTSGFVVWFLRHMRERVVEAPALGARADALAAAHRTRWDAIWQALDARRRADGTFEPWRHQSMRGFLERQHTAMTQSPHLLDRLSGHVLLPSLWLLSIAGE